MRKTTGSRDKKVSVRLIGNCVGGGLFVAIVAGLVCHRRAIKRLIEIRRM